MFLEQQIRVISEGSRNTEDWSNDAEITAVHHRNLFFKYIPIESIYFKYFKLDQINAGLVSRRDFFQKH